MVAMVIAILGIARVLEEFGLGDAAIQAERITDGEVTSLAIVNLVAGVGLAAGFMACAPLVARFYERPELVSICLALAPLFIFAGLGSQPRAMMRRRFRFRSLAIAQTVSLACAAVTGMVAAIAGLGVVGDRPAASRRGGRAGRRGLGSPRGGGLADRRRCRPSGRCSGTG